MITREQYEIAIDSIRKFRQIIRKAQEKVAKEQEVITEANQSLKKEIAIVRAFEEEKKIIHYSRLPQTLDELELSPGCIRLINKVIKSFGPDVKTNTLEVMLPYITIESLRAVSLWGPNKEQEIARELGKYGMKL